jgi:hypothetical protein
MLRIFNKYYVTPADLQYIIYYTSIIYPLRLFLLLSMKCRIIFMNGDGSIEVTVIPVIAERAVKWVPVKGIVRIVAVA